jgi:hypothetical protein
MRNQDGFMNRSMLKRAALGLLLCSTVAAASDRSTAGVRWIDTWTAAPDCAGPPLGAQTIRQIMRTSIGGTRVRIAAEQRPLNVLALRIRPS